MKIFKILFFLFLSYGAIGQITLDQLQSISTGVLGRSSGSGSILVMDASTTKTFLSLNNVENTALSTWAGSSNITTLGTIGTGTWNATAIADGKIASALTGKTYNGLTLTANATGFSIAGGTTSKTFTLSNTLTLAGTDGSTLNVGAGGTLGSAAFTNSTAYEVPLTFSTGLTRSTNTITVNTSQNIATLSNLTSNGYVKTSGGIGTLSVSSTVATSDLSGTVAVANGGTNLSALGTSLQQLRVNAGGTALEYFTPSAGSGDITNGGNTTGATVIIGTNDNNDLAFERNTVTYFTLGSLGVINHNTNTASTSTPVDNISSSANTSGTATLGFGSRVKLLAETATVADRDQVAFGGVWTNASATDASRTSAGVIYAVNNAGSLSEAARFTAATAPTLSIASAMGTAGTTTYGDAGITNGVAYTVGGSSNLVTLGGSSGNVTISSSGSGASVIKIQTSNATTGGITIGQTALTSTSLAKKNMAFTDTYTASSGSGVLTAISIENTFNLTSTASGAQIGIDINPTFTSLTAATFRGINIPYSNASAFGIYQAGTSTKNIFAGKTALGTTTAATEVLEVTGNGKYTGQYWSARYALTDAGTIALDWNNGNVQSVTLGGNRTFTFANPKDGSRYSIIIKQDATGSRTLTWPTIKWAGGTTPTLTTTANKYDIVTFIYDGTSYFGTISTNF